MNQSSLNETNERRVAAVICELIRNDRKGVASSLLDAYLAWARGDYEPALNLRMYIESDAELSYVISYIDEVMLAEPVIRIAAGLDVERPEFPFGEFDNGRHWREMAEVPEIEQPKYFD